jgi:transposase InsO family protein
VRSPTTTGKIERFHGSLRRELLNDAVPFASLAAAQAAVDAWVSEYNTTRPHQGIAMAAPADRFSAAAAPGGGRPAAAAAATGDPGRGPRTR